MECGKVWLRMTECLCCWTTEACRLEGVHTSLTLNREQSGGKGGKFWDNGASVSLPSLRWDSKYAPPPKHTHILAPAAQDDANKSRRMCALHIHQLTVRRHDPVMSYLEMRRRTNPSFWPTCSNLLFIKLNPLLPTFPSLQEIYLGNRHTGKGADFLLCLSNRLA